MKEIAEELRMKRTYDLDNASLGSLELPPWYTLGRVWVPRFILRHPHLTVAIRCRIESVRMDGAANPVLDVWFLTGKYYNKLRSKLHGFGNTPVQLLAPIQGFFEHLKILALKLKSSIEIYLREQKHGKFTESKAEYPMYRPHIELGAISHDHRPSAWLHFAILDCLGGETS